MLLHAVLPTFLAILSESGFLGPWRAISAAFPIARSRVPASLPGSTPCKRKSPIFRQEYRLRSTALLSLYCFVPMTSNKGWPVIRQPCSDMIYDKKQKQRKKKRTGRTVWQGTSQIKVFFRSSSKKEWFSQSGGRGWCQSAECPLLTGSGSLDRNAATRPLHLVGEPEGRVQNKVPC